MADRLAYFHVLPLQCYPVSRGLLPRARCASGLSTQTVPQSQRRLLPERVRPALHVPFLRATVCISGMESSSSSARCPILSLSSREIPGSEEILMVNEPSLKGGRNERPRVKKQPSATTNSPIIPPSTPFLCPNTKVSAEPYHASSCVLRKPLPHPLPCREGWLVHFPEYSFLPSEGDGGEASVSRSKYRRYGQCHNGRGDQCHR